jgi:hypothetical protein
VVGEDPILLFDDVMSELDERRREFLAGYFLESTQAVVTTTNLDYFGSEVLRRTRIIRISGGSIWRPQQMVQQASRRQLETGLNKPQTAAIRRWESAGMCYNLRVQSYEKKNVSARAPV